MRASIVSLSTGESGESGESKAELAAAAAALERLLSLEVEPIEAANATAGAAFRFEPRAAARGGGASAPVEDDIANGLGEIADIGGRGVGLLTLGLEIGLGGLLSPFGLASFVLFALLMNIGEFGDSPYRFAAYAPTAAEGDYYRPRDFEYAPELPAPWADQVDESDAPPASGLRTRPPVMSVGGGGAGPRHHRRRSFAHGIAAFGLACCTGLPAGALPAECYNGVMEQRQFLGLDPFAPPCNEADMGPLPIYPIVAARRTLDALLADEASFRAAVRLGQSTGSLQLPPEISPSLFERIAANVGEQGAELRAAGQAYITAAYDANELFEFAQRFHAQGRGDVEVCEFVDKALAAARLSSDALRRVMLVLPANALEGTGAPMPSSPSAKALEWERAGDAVRAARARGSAQ